MRYNSRISSLVKFGLVATSALVAPAMASAQTAQGSAAGAPEAQVGAKQDGAPGEEIIVSGFRASLDSALRAKREDLGIVDVINAEDIGKFPDTNLAEALQRIPGVVIDRDAGEGRSITVRGLGADFTRVRINGIEALATTGGTDSSGGSNRSRGFDFNVFAAELFNSITVRKSSSADVDEGSLGATVDLQAARPFDFNGFKMAGSLRARYNDLNEKIDPRAAFLISNTFADGMFGALVSVAYSKRRLNEEGFSTVRWDNGPSSQGFCAPIGLTSQGTNATQTTCGPAAQGVARLPNAPENVAAFNTARDVANFHPRLPRYGRLVHDQDRLGITGSLQFQPSDSTLISADFMFSNLSATREEIFLQAISFSRNAAAGGKPQTSVLESQYDANGGLLFGRYNGVDIRSESRFDDLSTRFFQPTLTIEQKLGDRIELNLRAGRADSKFRNPFQTTITMDAPNVNNYSIDFRENDRLPQISYPFNPTDPNGPLRFLGIPRVATGTQPSNITNTTASEIRIRPQGANNRNDVLHFDAKWEAIPGNLSLIAGGDLRRYEFDTFEFRRVNTNDTFFELAPGQAAGLTTQITGFGRNMNLPAGTATSWIIPDLQAIANALDIYCNCLQSGPAGGPGDFTLGSITVGPARGNNRRIEENNKAVFAMAEFRFDLGGIDMRGNAGLRYVETRTSATGFLATAGGTEVTVDNRYDDWLPSFNLSAGLTNNLIVRLAAAKVMARPQLGSLNPGGAINTTGNLTANIGNPLLAPFRANTVDASIEWYRPNGAFIGVGLFYKDIGSYVQNLRQVIEFNETGLPLSLLPPQFDGTEEFQVTTFVNTPGGDLKGIEVNVQQPFDFLPGFLKYTGFTGNFTFVESKIDYVTSPTNPEPIRDDLINLSPRSWNATLYYDDTKLSARVSGAYRSRFLTRVPGQNGNDVEGRNSTLNVDAQISYRINKRFELTLEGVNLTDQFIDQFISSQRNSVVVFNHTGREILFGGRFRY
jgi:iron complex outermembrane recepter protein